jgi:hypothetical protein
VTTRLAATRLSAANAYLSVSPSVCCVGRSFAPSRLVAPIAPRAACPQCVRDEVSHDEFPDWPVPPRWSVVLVFIYLVLALAEAGGLAACHWAFPRWFGCVLYVHESLAAGLIAAAGALTAAWIAWTAVQQQINAEKERTTADRRDGPRGE